MLNHIRLMFIALFMGVFLIACGDDSAQQDAAEETAAPSEMTSEETATETQEAAATEESNSVEGMTEEEAIEFFYYNVVGSWMGEYTPCFSEIF